MRTDEFLPRRRSVRLKDFDYTNARRYFITICVDDYRQLFGKVHGDAIALNRLGHVVENCWLALPDHFPNVTLGPYIVMPNHLHGILILQRPTSLGTAADNCSNAKVVHRAQHAVPLQDNMLPHDQRLREFGELAAGSVPTIIRSFKSAATRTVRRLLRKPNFTLWQRGFFEHVIRCEDDYEKTACYIRTNPVRWMFKRSQPKQSAINRLP